VKLRSLLVLPVLALLVVGGAVSAPERELYVVVLDDPPLAAYEGGIAGLAPTDPEVTGDSRLDADSAASRAYLSYLGSRHDEFLAAASAAAGRDLEARFRYDAVLNGVAVDLSSAEATMVAAVPGVERVVKDFTRDLLTDAGPSWIGAPAVWDGSGTGGLDGTQGEGVVVGVIDTGVNTDHPSFADPGPVDGFDHSNPKGRFFGACEPITGLPFCNDKLIGVWDFTGTTPEDTNGHGSHTASTSAGNVLDAQMFAPTLTLERRISGVAPHASLITYKACVTDCPITAILASINQATLDEVDVINYSIGGDSSDPWEDLSAVAFRNASAAGVFVSTSAGNAGPGAATMGSPADAPWVMAVGASTHNRDFPNSLVNMSGGDGAAPGDIRGKGVTIGYGPAPIVYAGDYGSALCGEGPAAPTGEAAINPFPPGTFDGEIVVCDRGTYGRVEKGQNVMEGGAGGYVLANDELNGDSLVADPHVLPGVHITYDDGVALRAWLASGSGHMATITGMSTNTSFANGDVMGSFSSRGPNPSVPDVIKPDITAPGVDVLAAFNTLDPTAPPEYGIISGTSMSSPHNAGAAALLRALHPDWTPDEVRSAMVTTGFTTLPGTGDEVHGVLKEDGQTAADPFDMGGGRVDLRSAGRAGLVLDETTAAYEAADPSTGGDPSSLNLPILGDADCASTCSWTRVVRSEASGDVTWTASVQAAAGLALSVEPSSFTLARGATQTLTVTADVRALGSDGWHFGQVVLAPGGGGVPESHLTVAVNRTAGGDFEQLTLHFHGNEHDGCTGVGNVDLATADPACPDGPTLSTDSELDPGDAAVFASNPLLTCAEGFDRCIAEPNWQWTVDGPTTLEGPMTVEFWWTCPACLGTAPVVVFLNEDWAIRLFVDGVEVVNQVVRNLSTLPAQARLVEATVNVPRVTAEERVVLRIEPVFVHQREAAIYYDSSQPCFTSLADACDSRVHMPVVVQQQADLVVADATASDARPREGVPVTVTATIANTGDAGAPASQTEFLLDGETVLGLVETPPIPAGGTETVTVEWDTRGVNGEHTIRIAADRGGAVAESDEGNNAGTLTVEIRGNKVRNGSFEQSSSGSSPDGWTSSGDTSYDGDSASAGPTGLWTSDPIDVVAGASYELVAQATGSSGLVVVEQLSGAGVVLGSVSLPALGALDEVVSVGTGVAQVRIVLKGGATGTTFDDVGLFER
jgi:subtilisin family serine protease